MSYIIIYTLFYRCAMRTGSRLLSGASMEDNSMLCEHTLLTSGEVAEAGGKYVGWPGKRFDNPKMTPRTMTPRTMTPSMSPANTLICPRCNSLPRTAAVTSCGHIFCERCLSEGSARGEPCPVCQKRMSSRSLMNKRYPF
jgi:hypothetical protein